MSRIRVFKTKAKKTEGAHLIARKDGVLCTICGELEPVHMGDGTPLPSLLNGYEDCKRRHPAKPHQKLWGA